MRFRFAALLSLVLAAVAPQAALAQQSCTADDFAKAVDASGASLRTFTLETQPKIQSRMRAYRDVLKLADNDYEGVAFDAIKDDKLAKLDQRSGELILLVDTLGRVPAGTTPDCAKLEEIKASSAELLLVIREKSDYILRRLDEKIAAAGGAPDVAAKAVTPQIVAKVPETAPKPEAPAKPEAVAKTEAAAKPDAAAAKAVTPQIVAKVPETAPKPAETAKSEVASKSQAAATPEVAAKKPDQAAKPEAAAKKAEPAAKSEWAATPKAEPAPKPAEKTALAATPNDAYVPPPLPDQALPPVGVTTDVEEDGYTIDQIREATRGFFGAVSTNLASVIEYTFKQVGRPTGYVLGTEGGGAFLAGLRYGKGTLFMRNASGTREVFWHGPSVGTDFGAAGSRTMFLIYKMHEPSQLYRSFSGIDGSAYFVGGVGLTLLKGGDVLMAPIRSGLGFRLGANLGYVRFTDQPTWNPF